MSDRLADFNAGRIEQVGAPADVYERPATVFVAGFVGTSNPLVGPIAEQIVGFTTGGERTAPIFILALLSRAPSPVVNVAAVIVILLSAIPVYIAARLTSDEGTVAGGRA